MRSIKNITLGVAAMSSLCVLMAPAFARTHTEKSHISESSPAHVHAHIHETQAMRRDQDFLFLQNVAGAQFSGHVKYKHMGHSGTLTVKLWDKYHPAGMMHRFGITPGQYMLRGEWTLSHSGEMKHGPIYATVKDSMLNLALTVQHPHHSETLLIRTPFRAAEFYDHKHSHNLEKILAGGEIKESNQMIGTLTHIGPTHTFRGLLSMDLIRQ